MISAERKTQLLQTWLSEEAQPFIGWDFSYLDGRMIEDQVPWSYAARSAELMRQSNSVLDLNTGGGERFLALRDHWPQKVVVTEEWPPNHALATERFKPFGVPVHNVRLTDTDPMPFADGEFDLVMNRHAAFNSAEVARVLAPNGTFITQQMHGLSSEKLQAVFGAKPQWPDAIPETYVSRLKRSGLAMIDLQNWRGNLRFTDVGAIVYYLKAVPWTVPNFSVLTHQNALLMLQAQLDAGQPLLFDTRSYLIEARK